MQDLSCSLTLSATDLATELQQTFNIEPAQSLDNPDLQPGNTAQEDDEGDFI